MDAGSGKASSWHSSAEKVPLAPLAPLAATGEMAEDHSSHFL